MPPFFFDVYHGPKLARDTDGLEFPGLEEAKRHAHEALGVMLSEAGYEERGTDFRVAVRDDSGVRVIVSLQTRVVER